MSMGRYQKHISSFPNSLIGDVASYLKDLARLMDEPLFTLERSNFHQMLSPRESAYGYFCLACKKLGISLPPLEEEILSHYLPKKRDSKKSEIKENLDLARRIRETIKVHDDSSLFDALATIFEVFPEIGEDSFYGINKKNLLAVLNTRLASMGFEPFRFLPEELPRIVDLSLKREVLVLIVDDTPGEILETALPLAGWPNLRVDWEYQSNDIGFDPKEEKKEEERKRMADAVISKNPDIILMDQGLKGIKGSDLIPRIKEALPFTVIIANTGGSPKELHSAGAIGSANKGETIQKAMFLAARNLC